MSVPSWLTRVETAVLAATWTVTLNAVVLLVSPARDARSTTTTVNQTYAITELVRTGMETISASATQDTLVSNYARNTSVYY